MQGRVIEIDKNKFKQILKENENKTVREVAQEVEKEFGIDIETMVKAIYLAGVYEFGLFHKLLGIQDNGELILFLLDRLNSGEIHAMANLKQRESLRILENATIIAVKGGQNEQ